MNLVNFSRLLPLLLSTAVITSHAATSPPPNANKSNTTAPVAAPETEPSTSTSGALVPNQPIRPEGIQEATDVPKTPMDKAAANSRDVGANKINNKQQTSGSGQPIPKEELPATKKK